MQPGGVIQHQQSTGLASSYSPQPAGLSKPVQVVSLTRQPSAGADHRCVNGREAGPYSNQFRRKLPGSAPELDRQPPQTASGNSILYRSLSIQPPSRVDVLLSQEPIGHLQNHRAVSLRPNVTVML